MARSIDATLSQFASYLKRSKGSADLTIAHYRDYLNRFFRGHHILSTADITGKKVQQFQSELASAKLQSTTINYHLIALRSFLRWLPQSERRIDYRRIELQPVRYHAPAVPSERAVASLLADQKRSEAASILVSRDRAMLELLWGSDIRLQEITELLVKNFDAKKKKLFVAGRRERTLQLNNHTLFYITEYLKQRTDQIPYLFTSHDRAKTKRAAASRISTRSIQRLVQKKSRKAGQGNSITARSIKHARAASQP